MEFSKRKLSNEMMESLYKVKIDTVQPFALMVGPVYVYLKENSKFVSVKAPLDFFIPRELERLKSYEHFYFTSFMDSMLPIREIAHSVKAILEQEKEEELEKDSPSEVVLSPPTFEISNAILKTMSNLWQKYPKKNPGIEPFLVNVFVNELCEPIPSDILLDCRERNIEGFEKALFHSSWVIFLALHLGYSDLDFLNQLRMNVFNIVSDLSPSGINRYLSKMKELGETSELIKVTSECLRENYLEPVKGSFFKKRAEKVSQKMFDRLKRIKKEFLHSRVTPLSIYGEQGFIDV